MATQNEWKQEYVGESCVTGDDTIGDEWTAFYRGPNGEGLEVYYYVVGAFEHQDTDGNEDYKNGQPVLIGYGVNEATCSWTAEDEDGQPLDPEYDYTSGTGWPYRLDTLEEANTIAFDLAHEDESWKMNRSETIER